MFMRTLGPRKALISIATLCVLSFHPTIISAQMSQGNSHAIAFRRATIDFATSTHDATTQRLIERGLLLYYAYNGPAAERVFREALQRNPRSAMASWGIALADGPNFNYPLTEQGFIKAKDAIAKAVKQEAGVSARERRYIDAMAPRYAGTYTDATRDNDRYIDIMGRFARAFPDDQNLTTLYVEAELEKAGTPALWTNLYAPERGEIERLLTSVLHRDPWNVMANHLLIHLYDSAPDRTAAIPSAERLAMLDVEPDAGHLVHMAAHAYTEQGYYALASAASARACALDRASKEHLYDAHDYFVGLEATLNGSNYAKAIGYVRSCATVGKQIPATDPEIVAARFYRWRDILRNQNTIGEMHGVLHIEALAALGRGPEAKSDLLTLEGTDPALPKAFPLLDAKVALANNDFLSALMYLQRALNKRSSEPPELDTVEYERETLGHIYYATGRYSDAERVFTEDLVLRPNNGRGLFGLWQTLIKEQKMDRADSVRRAFDEAWSGSDTQLTMSDL